MTVPLQCLDLPGALVSVASEDYRGYSWGTGQPSLKKLCSDADQCFRASETLLADAGFAKAKRVMFLDLDWKPFRLLVLCPLLSVEVIEMI